MRIGPTELIIIICLISILLLVGVLIATFLINAVRKSSPRIQAETEQRIPCPYCAEMILPGAKICRYCGRELSLGTSKDK